MKKVFAKINWIPQKEGGRPLPPKGMSYVTVSKFKGQTMEEWKRNAWSVRLDFVDGDGREDDDRYGFASFITEKAPHELLKPGFEFELYEGRHAVAKIEVLLSEKVVENLVKQMA